MKFLFIFSLCFVFYSEAQFNFEYNPNIPVFVGGLPMVNAWAGGLNYIQISDFDFDLDGDLDLFIFDRSSNNIRVYTQEYNGSNKYYALAHNSKQYFPPDLKYKALLVDYDMDGKKDLFTYGVSGLKVYKNASTGANGLQWELVKDLLYSQYVSVYSHLYVSSDDIPAIVDVDYDGDIDILTFHTGGETMEYHQNQSMELYGIPDSLVFELRNQCWGKFREDPTTSTITLNDLNYPCIGSDITNPIKIVHAGSTILAYDFDNSGVIDLVIGDASVSNLTLLTNSGSTPNMDSPMISVDASFPSNTTPASVNVFPASFLVDVDFDGIKDLIVSPNAAVVSENERSIRFYKNIGTNILPVFIYSERDFLQNQSIDHGSGSMPVFVDLNQDGMEDLIVANLYRYKPTIQKESTLAFYQNTGTLSNPSFTLVDDNFMNLSGQAFGLRTVPTFGDLDNDGDQDLILGRDNGTLVYYENISTGGMAAFAAPVLDYKDNLNQIISTGTSCFPQIFDLDDDGLLDLVIGQLNGQIRYFRNIGTTSIPSFELTNSTLGNVSISTSIPNTFSAPHFFRFDDTTYLFVGDVDGRMGFYKDIDDNLGSGMSFEQVSENYIDVDAGKYSSFWVNDLNNNGLLDLYVGQDLGGVYRFESDPLSTATLNEVKFEDKLIVYPNPVHSSLKIQMSNSKNLFDSYELRNATGAIVLRESKLSQEVLQIDLASFAKGIYHLFLKSEGSVYVEKIVKM